MTCIRGSHHYELHLLDGKPLESFLLETESGFYTCDKDLLIS